MNATDFIIGLSQNELEDIAAGSWLSDQALEFCGYLVGVNTAISMNTPYFGQAYK